MIAIDSKTCQSGGLTTAIRISISVGAKNGTIDNAIEAPLVGLAIIMLKITIGTTSKSVTGICACCASSSLDTVAPTNAYNVAYRK